MRQTRDLAVQAPVAVHSRHDGTPIRPAFKVRKRGISAPDPVMPDYWASVMLVTLLSALSAACRATAASLWACIASRSAMVMARVWLMWNNRRLETLMDFDPSIGRRPSAIQRLKVLTLTWGTASAKPAFLKARAVLTSFWMDFSLLPATAAALVSAFLPAIARATASAITRSRAALVKVTEGSLVIINSISMD